MGEEESEQRGSGVTLQTPEQLVARAIAIAPVKKEFLLHPPVRASSQNDDVSAPNHIPSFLAKEKKSKRQLKRERRQEPKSPRNLCPEIARTGDVTSCPYDDKCRFSHDLEAFKAQKPSDLEGECPFFKSGGSCPCGLACTFSSNHADEDGVPPANLNGVKKSSEVNGLSKDVQKLLRKKKMTFPKADANFNSLGLLGKSKRNDLENKDGDNTGSNKCDHSDDGIPCIVNSDSGSKLECSAEEVIKDDDIDGKSESDELCPWKRRKTEENYGPTEAEIVPLPTTDDGNNNNKNHWSPSLSSALYNVDGWGGPYFAVNAVGNISVRPHGSETLFHQEMDLLKIVKKASDPKSCGGLGLQLPLIIRFPDVLKHRLESLQSAFDYAIQSEGYNSHYQGVFPVKCNQDRFVVEDIVKFGSSFQFGLEAGSKPELLLSMSCLCQGSPEALMICNGFKDAEYISLALVANKLALNTVIVMEQERELDLIIDLSKKLCVKPMIGVRAKLRTKHCGHFGATSGEKGKFGLTTTQILNVVKKLEHAGMLDCLQLLHFHIGSQIPSTSLLADGVGEAAQLYCELVRLGANMRIIDIGGGLGIDYDGVKSCDSDASIGYDLQEYAAAVVHTIQGVCDHRFVKHPVICSESGRAIVSHHSVLVFEAVGVNAHGGSPALSTLGLEHLLEEFSENDARDDYNNLSAAAIRGDYETCLLYMEEMKQRCVEQFKKGSLRIEQLAAIEGLCELVRTAVGTAEPVRRYNVNLSVFMSVPDALSIYQVYPIVPIHRLDEKPSVRGILTDLTCDSDGKIDKFINGETSLPLHELEGRYYLGMFLGGAYEEALGGLHNLFGGPSLVRVSQTDGLQGFAVTSAVLGPSSGDVLRAMQHQPELMFETLKHRAQEYLHHDDAVALASGLARSFNNMPYLLPLSADDHFLVADSAPSGEEECEQWTY